MDFYDGFSQSQPLEHERSLIHTFIINHSFNLILTKHQHQFKNKSFKGLNHFIVQLFARSRISLRDYQKFLILMMRYLQNVDTIYLSPKLFILGLLVKLERFYLTSNDEKLDWSKISGLNEVQLSQLSQHFEIIDDEHGDLTVPSSTITTDNMNQSETKLNLNIESNELESISYIWKKLIYSKFQIIL